MWSSLAWLTQAHWACGQVTIKKVIFLPHVQSNQTETYLSSAAAGCISVYPWNPKLSLLFEKLKAEVKGTYSHRHFTFPVRKCRVQLSSKLPAKHWSCRRMKPSTGSHLPSENVKDKQLLAAPFNCCYAWIFHKPRIFGVIKRVRMSMSMKNACYQLSRCLLQGLCPWCGGCHSSPAEGTCFAAPPQRSPAPCVPERPAKPQITASARCSLFLCPSVLLLLPPVNLDYQCRSRLNFATISSD